MNPGGRSSQSLSAKRKIPDDCQLQEETRHLPPNWSAQWSTSQNHKYYYNRISRISSYTIPLWPVISVTPQTSMSDSLAIIDASKPVISHLPDRNVKPVTTSQLSNDASTKRSIIQSAPTPSVLYAASNSMAVNMQVKSVDIPVPISASVQTCSVAATFASNYALASSAGHVLSSSFYDFRRLPECSDLAAVGSSYTCQTETIGTVPNTLYANADITSPTVSIASPPPVWPLLEWYRAHTLRSLRCYFDQVNLEWLRRPAVKESFNRWLYLQLATPTPSVADPVRDPSPLLSAALNRIFAQVLPLQNLRPARDPLLRHPTAAARCEVLRAELRADLPARADRCQFSTIKSHKLRSLMEKYITATRTLLHSWLHIPITILSSTSGGGDVASSAWLQAATQQAIEVLHELNAVNEHECEMGIDDNYILGGGSQNSAPELRNQIAAAMQAVWHANHFIGRMEEAQPTSIRGGRGGGRSFGGNVEFGSDQIGEQLVRLRNDCAPIVDSLFLPRIARVCRLLARETERRLDILERLGTLLKLDSNTKVEDTTDSLLLRQCLVTVIHHQDLTELRLTAPLALVVNNSPEPTHTINTNTFSILDRITDTYIAGVNPLSASSDSILNLQRHVRELRLGSISNPAPILLLDSLTISSVHYDKLCALFALHSGLSDAANCTESETVADVHVSGRDQSVSQLLLTSMYSLLRRYHTLLDSTTASDFQPSLILQGASNSIGENMPGNALSVLDREGTGFHAAAPEAVFKVLRAQLSVAAEVFASPLNCYCDRYCSAFPDVDRWFGTLGSFFDFRPTTGSFECNPPFTLEVMDATAFYISALLSASSEPLSFAVMVPHWVDPPTLFIPHMESSPFCRLRFVVPALGHSYIVGGQQTSGTGVWNCMPFDIWLLSILHSMERTPLNTCLMWLGQLIDGALLTLKDNQSNEPLITLTFAQSLNGVIATEDRKPIRLSCEESFIMTHYLRSRHQSILLGIGTVLSDNPSLTTRLVSGASPRVVIVDTDLRTPLESKIMCNGCVDIGVPRSDLLHFYPPSPIIATKRAQTVDSGSSWHTRKLDLEQHGATVMECDLQDDGHISLLQICRMNTDFKKRYTRIDHIHKYDVNLRYGWSIWYNSVYCQICVCVKIEAGSLKTLFAIDSVMIEGGIGIISSVVSPKPFPHLCIITIAPLITYGLGISLASAATHRSPSLPSLSTVWPAPSTISGECALSNLDVHDAKDNSILPILTTDSVPSLPLMTALRFPEPTVWRIGDDIVVVTNFLSKMFSQR